MSSATVGSVAEYLRSRGMVEVHQEGPDTTLRRVSVNSRAADAGTLFVAVQGENTHGARYAPDALEHGATAVLTDREGATIVGESGADAGRDLSILVCKDPRRAAGFAADHVYREPSLEVPVVGVTGTNGKTSVTTMLARTLQVLGLTVGVVGTNGSALMHPDGGDERLPTERTTPEAPELHEVLAYMRESGVASAAIEVSSHAMVLHRVAGVRFSAVCFTNLSQDHLDFHSSMQEYFEAKASLFTPEHARTGVVCVDDEWGERLAASTQIPVTTYATKPEANADWVVTHVEPLAVGSRFTVRARDGREFTMTSPLPGLHYVANSLAVLLLAEALDLGLNDDELRDAIAYSGVVPGRMEVVGDGGTMPRVIVDYAHTPDALEKALVTIRGLAGVERVRVIMGAGGHRDASKRPVMGRVAAEYAHDVIITDDNPRDEDPAEIRAALREGATAAGCGACITVIPDRAEAIARTIADAGVRDVVLIAGKGAETGQDFGDRILDFDDRAHARKALLAWGSATKDGHYA